MSKKLVLIDGHSILNRAFYGVPDLTNASGLHTNAVYGFLNILFKILEEEKPDYLAVAFDVHAKTFRHEMYKEYKGTRKAMPDELREQVPVMKQVLRAMKIVIMEQAGLEADDLLGTMAKKAEKQGMTVSLVSGDRDLLQIATDTIKIRIPKTKMGRTEIEDYYATDVLEKMQVTPTQFIELKALMGDTADNIPGVPKIGEKTATGLMLEYGSIENIYAHLDEITKKSIRESLAENRELADLSKALATIKIDCDIELDYELAQVHDFYTKEAYQIFKDLEFKQLLKRFDDSIDKGEFDLQKSIVLLEDLQGFMKAAEEAKKCQEIGLHLEIQKGELIGIAICLSDEKVYYFKVNNGQDANGQLSLFEQPSSLPEIKKVLYDLSDNVRIDVFDIKKKYEYLNMDKVSEYFDSLLASYLLNPLKNDYDVINLGSEYLNIRVPEFDMKHLTEDEKKLCEYCCYCAFVARASRKILEDKLIENGMENLYREMEMPLTCVLYDMEKEGILVKKHALQEYGQALVSRISQLEKRIHEQAGMEFNIQSPKQLGEVLFEKMNLPGGKKTKTGYSTAAEVLEKLAGEYEIVKDILEYRGLTKLKSTYADGLVNYIEADGRIHTNFNQMITATGRISSTEPNLQNIPMRTEIGRQIRKVFVPEEGKIFMDADYSQIELRVLAHMSGDEQLIEAYKMDEDIHRITASKVFHTPFEEVTDLQRRNAKAVNFGIVYGISSFGLSQDLSISTKEASEYIKQYFETYPKVKEFLDGLVSEAKEKGFVTTMYGRRRPIPELASSNFMQRSFGERVAMNSPIQGTAADIIKIAMIKVYKALKDEGLKSKIILQVHDELLIETYKEEEERVHAILEQNMREAAALKVALEIDLHTGTDWYEAK